MAKWIHATSAILSAERSAAGTRCSCKQHGRRLLESNPVLAAMCRPTLVISSGFFGSHAIAAKLSMGCAIADALTLNATRGALADLQ